ncbi:MAG: tetratricopeptide repeat protein [Planctomycetota bacterium]
MSKENKFETGSKASQEIDRICDEFEQSWQDGSNPKIEDYISDAPEQFKAELAAELVALDISYRRAAGEAPGPDEYADRFSYAISDMRPYLMSLVDGDTVETREMVDDTSYGSTPRRNRRLDDIGREFGPYELIEEIARGGMGVVFRARHKRTNRTVALKMILAGRFADETEISRFHTEAEAIARLDHPHIVPVFDAGEFEGYHYIAMGFVDGGNLGQYCGESALPAQAAADLVRMLAQAMEYAHQNNIVHRDLKPANILLSKGMQPRITDFGLARQIESDSGMTKTGQILGTPGFMPPEQASGKMSEVGPLADVYSLGAILYNLISGRSPFRGESVWDTINQVLNDEPVAPRDLNPSIPRDLETICLKCLQKDPSRRYSSAADLAAELDRFISNEPIHARPISATARFYRWCQRNQRVAALGFAFISTLIIGTIVATYFAFLAQSRADELADNYEQLEIVNGLEIAAREKATSEKNRADRKAEEAETARDIARASEKRATDVLGIVTGSFDSADPDVGGDSEMLARDVLLTAYEKLGDSELDEEGRIYLLDSLVRCYIGIGEYRLAADTGDELLAILDKVELDSEAAISEMLNMVGVAHSNAGNFVRSIELLDEAVLRTEHADDVESHLAYLNNLATALDSSGQPERGRQIREDMLAATIEVQGLENSNTLSLINNLAVSYSNDGLQDEAIRLLEMALPIRKEFNGVDHPRTLAAMSNLAMSYSDVGRNEDSIELLNETLELAKVKLGIDHPNTLVAMGNLATIYQREGNLDDAINMLEQTLEGMRAKNGENHPDTMVTMNKLASTYSQANMHEEALKLHKRAFSIMRGTLGPDHPATLSAMNNLGTTYWRSGNQDKAIETFERGVEMAVRRFGEDHTNTLAFKGNLGINYSGAGRHEEAIQILEEVYELAPDVNVLPWLKPAFRSALLKAGDEERFRVLADEEIAIARSELEPASEELADKFAMLSLDLIKVGDVQLAEELLNECVEIRERLSPDSWSTFNAQSMLGETIMAKGDFEGAFSTLLSGYEGLQARQSEIPEGYRTTRLVEALERLIQCCEELGKQEQAEEFRAELSRINSESDEDLEEY